PDASDIYPLSLTTLFRSLSGPPERMAQKGEPPLRRRKGVRSLSGNGTPVEGGDCERICPDSACQGELGERRYQRLDPRLKAVYSGSCQGGPPLRWRPPLRTGRRRGNLERDRDGRKDN